MRTLENSIMSMVLLSAISVNFVSCGPKPEPPEPVKVTGVSVSPATHELEIDRKYTLTATVTPANAENKAVTWSSDRPDIATVDATTGEVTAIAVIEDGVAVITATTEDGDFADACTVTVVPEPIRVTGMGIRRTKFVLKIDDTYTLTADVLPKDATNQTVTWLSDRPDIMTVNATTGEVTALAEGVAKITATTADGGLTDKISIMSVHPSPDVPSEVDFFYQSGSIDDLGNDRKNRLKLRKDWLSVEVDVASREEAVIWAGNDMFTYPPGRAYVVGPLPNPYTPHYYVFPMIDTLTTTIDDVRRLPGVVSAAHGLEWEDYGMIYFPINQISVMMSNVKIERVLEEAGLTEYVEAIYDNMLTYSIVLSMPLDHIVWAANKLFETGIINGAWPIFFSLSN